MPRGWAFALAAGSELAQALAAADADVGKRCDEAFSEVGVGQPRTGVEVPAGISRPRAKRSASCRL